MTIKLSPAQAQDALLRMATERIARDGRALIAVDGMAASGKTTLARRLADALPGAHVVHMDDFFLPPEKRAGDYRARMLANADIERFDAEVLTPLARGEGAVYRPFVCHPEMTFLPPVTIPADWRAVIVEGAYCLHPALFGRYGLRALMTIGEETQKRRILARNGEAMLTRFLGEWIPLENRHIAQRNLRALCDAVIETP